MGRILRGHQRSAVRRKAIFYAIGSGVLVAYLWLLLGTVKW